ncbi:hypothetical protein N7486_005434 [Penicillium sp. IBT 16267x]|nr:hypothetical protein N7486_005434 [Penicillium sp. IBT 16267x]
MTSPEPPMSLEGHCSAVYNSTLYVYSPDGFASLSLEPSLERNATWIPLSPGVNVTGAACVTAAIEADNDNLAFYVVGGTGNSSNYSGLQQYSYQDQKWTTLHGSSYLQNLLGHGVGYLEDAAAILVYGGNQNSNTASQSTYVLSTSYPYGTQSRVPQGVPPAVSPMLLKWNESTIALIGGYTSTTEVYIYGNTTGWVASGATLPSDVASATGRFAIVSDDEGNKILEDFDMDVSPNTITSYEMIKDGIALAPAPVTGSSSSKRSLSHYPPYNNTNAGTTTRSDYAIAQSSNNLVVISSGSGNNSVSIFNQTSNSWINTTELFYGSGTQSVLHGTTTTTTSSTPTATASSTASTTPSSSPTAAAAASGSSGEQVGVIIGATLGGICGAIIILVAILFLLRRAREKQNSEGQAKGGDGKDRLSFQDQGEPLTEGAYPMAKSPVPVATVSDDSLAMMSGKYAGEKALRAPNQSYGYGLGKQGLSPIPSSGLAPSSMYSDDSDRSAAVAAAVEAISSPGNKPGDRTTDEGWGKYFDDNRATNLAGRQSHRSTMSSAYTKSDYRGSSAWPMSNLAPLDFGFLDQPKPLGQVHSGSPTTEVGGHTGRSLFIPESQSARISSADSVSIASDDDPHDTNWTGAAHSSWLGRPTSSNYSNSYYGASNTNLPARNSQSYARNSNARRSSVIIPDDIDELPPSGNYNSDMSWLNLHAER